MLPEELCWEICQYIQKNDSSYVVMWILSGYYARYNFERNLIVEDTYIGSDWDEYEIRYYNSKTLELYKTCNILQKNINIEYCNEIISAIHFNDQIINIHGLSKVITPEILNEIDQCKSDIADLKRYHEIYA